MVQPTPDRTRNAAGWVFDNALSTVDVFNAILNDMPAAPRTVRLRASTATFSSPSTHASNTTSDARPPAPGTLGAATHGQAGADGIGRYMDRYMATTTTPQDSGQSVHGP